MSLSISVRIPSGAVRGIRDRLQQRVNSSRDQLVQSATESALGNIIESVPVDTGQTRGEWQSNLTQVRSSPPSHPTEHVSLQSATNAVEQVIYLEYGTIHMPPRGIARGALNWLQSQIQALFHFHS